MRKRGKKLLAIMLAASMTLGQGSTGTLAQEDVAEYSEDTGINVQSDTGNELTLNVGDGESEFGDGTENNGDGDQTENDGDETTPGDNGDDSGDKNTGDGENTGDDDNSSGENGDSENGADNSGNDENTGDNDDNSDDNNSGNNQESGDTNGDGNLNNPDNDTAKNPENTGNQPGTPSEDTSSDDLFGTPEDDTQEDNGAENESKVLTARLTVKDGTDSVWGSGILTGSGEMDQISWDPESDTNRGYDGALDNKVIRSFDSITYNVGVTFTTNNEAHTLVYEVTLPDDNELSLDEGAMHANRISVTQNEGGTKTYKCVYSLEADYAGGGKEENVVVKVGNKHQGYEIIPQIRAYLDDAQDQAETVNNMKTVTVTSAPMYNIVLKKKASTSASRGVYDFSNTPYAENATGYKDGKVIGYEQTFGLALELRKPVQGIKGVELPDPNSDFTFDIDLSDATLEGNNMPAEQFVPLLYECTVNQSGGAAVWEIPFTKQGFNTNGVQSGCYNSGTYTMRQEGTTLHVTVKGFAIDRTQYPKSNLANQSYWEDINEIREGIFSAFQFKVIYPYERADGKNLQEIIGDGTVNVNAGVNNMLAVSETQTTTTAESTMDDNYQSASWELRSGGKRSQAIWYSSRNLWTDEYTPGKKWDDGDMAAAGTTDVAFTVNYTEEQTGPAYSAGHVPVAIDQLVVFDSSALKNITFSSASGSDKGYSSKILYAVHKGGRLTNDTMRNVGIDDFTYSETKQENVDYDAVLVQYRGIDTAGPDLNLLAQFFADINPNVEDAKVYMVAAVTNSWTAEDFSDEILSATGKTNLTEVSRNEISKWAKNNLQGMLYEHSRTPGALDGRQNYTVPGYTNGQYDVDGSHKFSIAWADGLYIVPYTTTVTTTVAQLDEDGNPRSKYDMGKGQRYVDYAISTSIKYTNNVPIPKDATTTVYLEETIPAELTYVPGSAYWGGSYVSQFPEAGNVEGGTQYEPEITEITKEGKQYKVLRWAIPNVALKNGELPKMHYTCMIGNELDPSHDVDDGQILDNTTTIQTDEDKRPILSRYDNISGASITVTRAKEFYIVKRGGAHLELQGSSYYEMIAANTSSNDVRDLCIFDTMPYNNSDVKNTQKKGRYTITSLTLDAAGLKNNTGDIEIWYTNDSDYAGKTAKEISKTEVAGSKWKQAVSSIENGVVRFTGDGLIGCMADSDRL